MGLDNASEVAGAAQHFFDDELVCASRGVDPPTFRYWISLVHAVIDFQGPRIAQFYAYMLGLVSVGAAGFTLAQMVRSRELVAILATGTSLVRVGMVFIVVATGLNLLQLANQEVLLPRLAPLLVRGQGEILEGGLREFPVRLTRDGRGQLLWGKALDPHEERITGFLLIERDGQVLSTVPEQGKNPFGRPVFQNLQYSDTPTQPLVPMEFVDATADAGTTHGYRVIAVNTAGLQSPASPSVTGSTGSR